ncbi:hypothetical protein VbVaMValp1_34 [Vibrio phage Vb_VaM_Valp1]
MLLFAHTESKQCKLVVREPISESNTFTLIDGCMGRINPLPVALDLP